MRLRVDWIRCDGYGLCGDLLPDLIPLDEWRYPFPHAVRSTADGSTTSNGRWTAAR